MIGLNERIAIALRKLLELRRKEISQIQLDMTRAIRIKLDSAGLGLQVLSGKLDALSPLKVLERGYSITQMFPSMRVIRESKELQSGDKVLIRFHSGKARCSVDETED